MTKETVYDRLLSRELGNRNRYSNIRGIYGDRKWIRDLDIVNELDGHRGCVNALSWSKTGTLLASGSDDKNLNIHSYQPESSTSPFKWATTVATGHTANIFSVKFMPHSDDRVLVTCAGDADVRIFDIEHSSRQSTSHNLRRGSSGGESGFREHGVQYLSEGDTNAKVYRSHSDRVKRIVTESSPHLFLTCSEDGEVRQWDLRQPSSAYPRGEAPQSAFVFSRGDVAMGDAPPPLISYKRWGLDLNTISCSASQPHYIALGGTHLHCFLHDRRMLGRDRNLERGSSVTSSATSQHDDEAMGEATQCVKRFAPNGKRKMKSSDSGQITACKISDANPNEMIASWTADWIYSFDLLRTPDAREAKSPNGTMNETQKNSRANQSSDRKRKRRAEGSAVSQEGARRANSKPRRAPAEAGGDENEQVSLRVRYENGQTESILLQHSHESGAQPREGPGATLSDAERESRRIALMSIKIRKHMFTLPEPRQVSATELTGYTPAFTSALGFAASVLDDMDDIMRAWRYPVDPDELDVIYQNTLRRNRQSARRFVQAAGTVARLLGGKLHTAGTRTSDALDKFVKIVPAPNETEILDQSERFSYDFLKAILLWLDSGVSNLVEGFSKQRNQYRNNSRFPLPENAAVEDIDETLIPYLLRMAGERPIPNVDASQFEVDERRKVFDSEKAAVLAFAQAVKIPFEDLASAVVPASDAASSTSAADRIRAQDRRTALRFWGLKVARGLLLNAGEGVKYAFVDHAFGGLGRESASVTEEERVLAQRLESIDPEEHEPLIESVGLERGTSEDASTNEPSSSQEPAVSHIQPTVEDEDEEEEAFVHVDDIREVVAEALVRPDDDNADSDNGDDDRDGSEDSEDDEDEDEETTERGHPSHHFLFRSALDRSAIRRKAQKHTPCATHERYYKGHCNVQTVKDVNFYGLNDEYVVSGSDSGHVFIWDRATSQIVNILEGDGEIVNVAQGHPYEPMLAVSGIDSTVKIFSADARAIRDARLGIGVTPADASQFSSLHLRRSRRGAAGRARAPSPPQPGDGDADAAKGATSEPAVPGPTAAEDDDSDRPRAAENGLASRRRLHMEYQITSQNDVDRRCQSRSAAFLTRDMLAQLFMSLQMQRGLGGAGGAQAQGGGGGAGGGGGGGGGGGEDDDDEDGGLPAGLTAGEGGPVIVSDDCNVM